MTVRPVLKYPDARLSQPCDPVGAEDVSALIADMFDTMYAAYGRGLAGPQIGVMTRVFVMDATWKDGPRSPIAVLNPVIVPVGAEAEGEEACLSVPGVSARVIRPATIDLQYETADRLPRRVTLTGAAARIVQHETDHLDGLLHWDRMSPGARAALIAEYEALT
ncbi:peptide deformylase [Mesobacterium sp. TK19101]|uniref:Peptide deformylase n=1 Tax=Mesobacterium hydrothermale TaxID=3111907 RepID=A0ABU6HKD0_9RHOB|nr:peptide deformylase [Mesobacterium sp. TK19101]MEC3862923.1 peptide deformylase [Mesobacterium sp. TK19101]